jgi:hypothetical protein
MNHRLKIILVSVGSIIGIAALAFGALLLLNQQEAQQQQEPATPTASVEPGQVDTSKDYGACAVLEKSTIQAALGEPAASLQGPDDLGRVYIGSQFGDQIEGDESQTCVYAFIEGGTFENGFNGQHGISVEVYVHANQASLDAFAIEQEPGVVVGTQEGDKTYFISADVVEPAGTSYSLTRISGLKHYTITLREPNDAATFTAESAKAVLESLSAQLTI